MAIGNARAEKISGECAANSSAQNIIGVIAGKVRDCTEPVICIVGDRGAATVHAETIDSRSGWIFPHVGITREHIKFRDLLRLCSRAEKRSKSQQTHCDLQFHSASK